MTTQTIGLQPTGPDTATQQAVMGQVRTLIENEIRSQPRSQQKMIGPSEIGTECDHCLAARLAGWDKNEQEIGWLAHIGTTVHAWLEQLFTTINDEELGNGHDRIALTEQKVNVGQIRGQDVWGSTDLFLPDQLGTAPEGMTVDWKIVGNNTLNKVKRDGHPGQKYEAQAHLYARGWNNAGHPTSHVAVYFMPRNKMSLADGHVWIDQYRPDIAEQALERANRIALNLDALETISTEARDQWITSLERDPDCWDCKKYADYYQDQDGTTDLSRALNL